MMPNQEQDDNKNDMNSMSIMLRSTNIAASSSSNNAPITLQHQRQWQGHRVLDYIFQQMEPSSHQFSSTFHLSPHHIVSLVLLLCLYLAPYIILPLRSSMYGALQTETNPMSEMSTIETDWQKYPPLLMMYLKYSTRTLRIHHFCIATAKTRN